MQELLEDKLTAPESFKQILLLLEDQRTTREALKRVLAKKFPALTIKAAKDETEALAILRECDGEDVGLYGAILDLKVPPTENANPDVSSICEIVLHMFPNAIVGHITAHNDEEIQLHMDQCHRKSDFPVFRVHKGEDDVTWSQRVVNELAGAPIERRLSVLRTGSDPRSNAPRQVGPRHQSGTFQRAALIRDIGRHWKLLDPKLKEKIKRYFTVDENYDPPIVR